MRQGEGGKGYVGVRWSEIRSGRVRQGEAR